jgi:hypothetical protein
MVDRLKIIGNGIWLAATLCLFLLTYNAFANISSQEDKKVINSKSSIRILPAFASEEAFSKAGSPFNNSAGNEASLSNSTFFLKYNNLGNNHNKAESSSYNFPRYPNSQPSYEQFLPSTPTNSYYNPAYNHYPGSFGLYPYPQLMPPSYFSYPQSPTQFTPSLSLGSPTYPWAVSPSSGISAQQHFLSSPIPSPFPPPQSYPPVHSPEIAKESSLESDDSLGGNQSKMVSPWFPSIPASDCEGVFEFTVEGTTQLQAENLKSGNHKITIKMTSASPDSIDGQLWVDKKANNDKGNKFKIDKTFNNCRVVTASSTPSSVGQEESSSSSLLQSLLGDLPEDDYSADEQLTYEADDNRNSQQQEADQEDAEGTESDRKVEIAALD